MPSAVSSSSSTSTRSPPLLSSWLGHPPLTPPRQRRHHPPPPPHLRPLRRRLGRRQPLHHRRVDDQEFRQILEEEFDTASQIDSVLLLFIFPMPSITATTGAAGAADDDVDDILVPDLRSFTNFCHRCSGGVAFLPGLWSYRK
ncbi:hypothetical protein RHMOL_Rhmol12G0158300 [Rhododendron molle]|uniref:Uncharacterized protein n=1 Tax=Rhododendron molle TaxID=49168 RepID=A0ACC0LIN1_RHOML|nr:hypothetical protein RHMOL_Rhmol12G0158300 [Rhododendron molle]